jgi:uncharacterized membrane protein
MKSTRLEAFSDGVIAIIITIMVLDLKVPTDPSPKSLARLLPVFGSYALSFVLVAIYWGNHHHLLHLAKKVDGRIIWTNANLLFWMSLMPFATAYLGQNRAAPLSVAFYAVVQMVCSIAFLILQLSITRQHDGDPALVALRAQMARKNGIATLICLATIPAAFISVPVAMVLIVMPAVMYFLPDRRVEARETIHFPGT